MAHLYQAEIRPTKLELLQQWVPTQPWGRSAADGALERVGAFRFDDPDGEVGIETFLVRTPGGPLLQVPLTYRASALEGADAALITTMDHSVLGRRWVYDGCGDPVYVQAALAAIRTGGRQADEFVETDAGLVRREPTTFVTGSGSAGTPIPEVVAPVARSDAEQTVVDADQASLVVRRVLVGADLQRGTPSPYALLGRWPGQDDEVELVTVSPRPAEAGSRP
ncbi:hypothetical protein KV102_01750 [Mumia sp. zg.B53]|uniref:CG0192-related protein n=1 Tax=Mumia sp. zg.B53 TaxID=2855449 RepID=UPI001C6ECA5F|nr:hypothetical protein [Mumia sp. zg.B53]MBW9213554.1 hypothetical protein [Mumia sp. zg.B53]